MTTVYRTLIYIEVLSDGPYEYTGLDVLEYDTVDGDCSKVVSVVSSMALTQEGAIKACRKHGTDPEFFFGECYEEEE